VSSAPVDKLQLIEHARTVTPALMTEGVPVLVRSIAKALEEDVPPEEVLFFEAIILTLQLLDRALFVHLGPVNRDIFMDTVLELIADGLTRLDIDVEGFRQSYNDRLREYSQYREIITQPPKGSFGWEWGKRLALQYPRNSAVSIPLLGVLASEQYIVLVKTLRELGVFAPEVQ